MSHVTAHWEMFPPVEGRQVPTDKLSEAESTFPKEVGLTEAGNLEVEPPEVTKQLEVALPPALPPVVFTSENVEVGEIPTANSPGCSGHAAAIGASALVSM